MLIQYVPFLYGRRGLARTPARIARMAKSRGVRTTVFVHEPWVPPSRLPWLILSPLQRRQLLGLAAVTDAVVTPVPAWAALLGPATHVLYVGSTLGELPSDDTSEPPPPSPVVFSPFAAGLNWDWICAAVEAIGSGLTVVGCDRETALAHPVVGSKMSPQWEYRGRLPAPRVLATLSGSQLVLAPFVDGLTGRRTSAMAAMSVGAPLLSSRGRLFDAAFASGPTATATSRSDFVRQAQEIWASQSADRDRDARVAWYKEHLDSSVLDRRLLEIMMGEPAS